MSSKLCSDEDGTKSMLSMDLEGKEGGREGGWVCPGLAGIRSVIPATRVAEEGG